MPSKRETPEKKLQEDLQRAEKERKEKAVSRSRWNTLLLPPRIIPELQPVKISSGEGHIDSLFVTCKAQSTVTAIRQVKHRLSSRSTIVLLQNGNLASHEKLLQTVFMEESERPHFILVSNTHGVWLKRPPFHTVHAGVGKLFFGIVPGGKRDFDKPFHNTENPSKHPRLHLDNIALARGDPEIVCYRSLRNTVAILQGLSGLHPSWEPFAKMQVLLRRKLVVNCVINPLSAIFGCRNGELVNSPAAQRIAFRICKEAADVFKKEAMANARPGIDPSDVYIPPELEASNLFLECKRVSTLTSNNMSSMLADLKKGNKITEIEYLNGYLLTLGTRYNQLMPMNATLLDLVLLRSEIPLDTMM